MAKTVPIYGSAQVMLGDNEIDSIKRDYVFLKEYDLHENLRITAFNFYVIRNAYEKRNLEENKSYDSRRNAEAFLKIKLKDVFQEGARRVAEVDGEPTHEFELFYQRCKNVIED